MRAMLIPILLCSLAPFAATQGSTRKAVLDKEATGCGGVLYVCYVPKMCTDTSQQDISQSGIVLLGDGVKISDDCPAIIKIHPYRKYWVHVTLESLVPTTKYIIFTQHDRTNTIKNEFSCKPEGKTLVGKYVKSTSPPKTVTAINQIPPTPIKCVIEVKLQNNEDMFNINKMDNFQFKINQENKDLETKSQSKFNPITDQFCVPSDIEYNAKHKMYKNKVYGKVLHKPGEYYCEFPVYTMEYLPNDAKDDQNYTQNVKLTCDNDEPSYHHVNGGPPAPGYLDIRCVADAKYFCAYDVKMSSNGQPLDQIRGNLITAIESKLNCPDKHKYLFVKGKPMLDSNRKSKEIECLNYGGATVWTVDGVPLYTHGPEVYCTDTLECENMYKIPESSIEDGKLNPKYHPVCFNKDGELLDTDQKKVSDFGCDKSTGYWTYTAGTDTEKTKVLPTTKFKCKYPPPPEDNTQAAKENRELVGGVVAVAAIGIAASIGFVVGMGVRTKNKLKREDEAKRKKAEEFDQKMFKELALTKAEKAIADKEEKEANDGKNAKVKLVTDATWSDFVVNSKYDAMSSFSPTGTEQNYIATPEFNTIDTSGRNSAKILSEGGKIKSSDAFMQQVKNYLKSSKVMKQLDKNMKEKGAFLKKKKEKKADKNSQKKKKTQ